MCYRARKTMRSPALRSADIVHRRNDTLTECGPERKLAHPMLFRMACRAQWNGVAIGRLHPDAASVAVRTCAASDGAALAAGNTGKLSDKSQVLPRRCKLGRGLPRAMVLGMREVGIGLKNCQRVGVRGKIGWAGPSWARQGTSFGMSGTMSPGASLKPVGALFGNRPSPVTDPRPTVGCVTTA
jgi:hypothetical protein